MKRIAALLMVLCLVAGVVSAWAEATGTEAYANCEANVRKGPSIRNDIVFRLEPGTRVLVEETLTENGETWCRITVAGSARAGYILEKLLDFGAEGAALVVPSQPDAAQTAAAPLPAEPARQARTKCEVNLRKAPSATALVLSELPSLTDVMAGETVEGGNVGWTYVTVLSTGAEGYVQSNLLDYAPEKTAEELAAEEAVAATAVKTPQQTSPSAAVDKRYSDGTNLSRRIDSSYYYYLLGESTATLSRMFDDETLAAYRDLKVGDSGEDVLAMKNRLTELGYYRDYLLLGPNFSEATVEYVQRFQTVNGLEATGEADTITQALLYSEYALGADEEDQSRLPVEITNARIVSYDKSSAVQVDFRNRTGGQITGFSLQIIPYSAYGKPMGLKDTLAEQALRAYPKKASVGKGGSYSDGARGNYFVIDEGQYYAGALVTVSSYINAAGVQVPIDSEKRSWFTIGTADATGVFSEQESTYLGTAALERANGWDMGFTCEYALPVYRREYSVPEGLVVTSVENSNYGAWAGLKPGDVLLVMNTEPLLGTMALERAKSSVKTDDTFELVFWRDGLYYASTLQR